MDALRQIISFPGRAAISTLRNYQLQHRHEIQSKRCCRYSPRCADYAIEAIARHGLLVGGSKGCWRVLRCRFGSGETKPEVNAGEAGR